MVGEGVDLDELVSRVGSVGALAVLHDAPAEEAPSRLFPTFHSLLHIEAIAREALEVERERHSSTSVVPQREQ